MSYDPESRLRYCMEQRAKRKEEEEKRKAEEYQKHLENGGQPKPPERSWEEHMYVDADKPGTIDNTTATIWYIIVMVAGAIFNDRWLIWIMATIVWWRHINRKKRRQKEWDEKHKNDKT